MGQKQKTTKDGATEVFRQFAWNLAGTLARPGARRPPAASRPGQAAKP